MRTERERRLLRLSLILRIVLATAMIVVGALHFIDEEFFVRIVPKALPFPRLLVAISGVCEIGLAIALLVPKTRRLAGFGLIALYVAVFPANINMVVHPELGGDVPLWALWVRLPLQLVLIAWAWWVSRREHVL
jgi:uncharacterized membrane protein